MNTVYANNESSLIEATIEDTAVCLLTLTKKVEIQEYLHPYTEYLCYLLNGRIQRLLLGELVTPLLHWIDRPIRIAKPTETL